MGWDSGFDLYPIRCHGHVAMDVSYALAAECWKLSGELWQ